MQPTTASINAEATRLSQTAVESVLFALMTIGRLLRQRIQGDGLDPGTFWLLKSLAAHDAMRVTELATLAGLDASTVSRHVQQMQRAGLIQRTQDPDDGRAQQVTLSAHGRRLLDEGLTHRRELLANSLEDWDARDIETFNTLLNRFVGNIENNTELEHA
jgi:DNA-binding MarR family transcriptional regulator